VNFALLLRIRRRAFVNTKKKQRPTKYDVNRIASCQKPDAPHENRLGIFLVSYTKISTPVNKPCIKSKKYQDNLTENRACDHRILPVAAYICQNPCIYVRILVYMPESLSMLLESLYICQNPCIYCGNRVGAAHLHMRDLRAGEACGCVFRVRASSQKHVEQTGH